VDNPIFKCKVKAECAIEESQHISSLTNSNIETSFLTASALLHFFAKC
jgi:hypothetical protein